MPSDLKHFGILGMKWGVRRYRDSSSGRVIPDKYLSPAKAENLRKAGGSTPTVSPSSESSSQSSPVKPKLQDMTTLELRNAIERINLEKQYKQLMSKEISPGMKFVNSVLADSGKKAASSLATKYMIKGGDKAIQEMIKALNKK
jgi:riboflavin biosynthesis pyrimidine reductase